MVSSVNGSSSTSVKQAAGTSEGSLTSALGGTKALGQDSFLKLLIAQIEHQDPLKPMDDTAFVAQLAQFSSLEQQLSTNKLLELLNTQQRGLANNTITDLVGRNVTVRGSSVTLDASGVGAPMNFTLGSAAETTTITIRNSDGKTVRTLEAGAKPAGLVSVHWDGKDDTGTVQVPGTYTVSVSAKSSSGTSVDVSQQTSGTVTSISFDKGYANLTLSNGVSAPASELLQVNQ